MITAGLLCLLLALIALRQNLLVLLDSALVYLYLTVSGDPLRFILLDAWQAHSARSRGHLGSATKGGDA